MMKPSEHGNGDDAGKVGSRFERLRDRHALADSLTGARQRGPSESAAHAHKARFWIPGNLAYGDKPARSGTPTDPLVFDIELLSIK
jgi:hypothetical protein